MSEGKTVEEMAAYWCEIALGHARDVIALQEQLAKTRAELDRLWAREDLWEEREKELTELRSRAKVWTHVTAMLDKMGAHETFKTVGGMSVLSSVDASAPLALCPVCNQVACDHVTGGVK